MVVYNRYPHQICTMVSMLQACVAQHALWYTQYSQQQASHSMIYQGCPKTTEVVKGFPHWVTPPVTTTPLTATHQRICTQQYTKYHTQHAIPDSTMGYDVHTARIMVYQQYPIPHMASIPHTGTPRVDTGIPQCTIVHQIGHLVWYPKHHHQI